MAGIGFALQLLAGAAVQFVVANAWRLVAAYALNRLLYKKPKFSSETDGHRQLVRSAIAEHIVVYGSDKVSGPMVYAGTTGNRNEYLHMVIAVAAHEVDAIDSVYFNDLEIKNSDLDGSGNVIAGRFQGKARIKKHLGSVSQVADPDMVAELGAKISNSVVTAISITYHLAKEFIADQSGNADIQYSYWDGLTPGSGSYEIRINNVLVSGTQVTTGGTGVFIVKNDSITVSKGDLIQIFQSPATEYTEVRLASSSQQAWTTDHKLSGRAYIYVRMEYDPTIYPGGLPQITCLVKGKKVYDPRTTTTVWSNNPALIIRDYIISSYGLGATASDIDDSAIITAANICDELVSVPDGSGGTTTQKRYECDGSVNTGATPQQVMEGLLTSCAGSLVWFEGKYNLQVGAYVTPTVTLDESDLRGGVSVIPTMPRKDLFNAVRGTFVDPSNVYTPTDFPPYIDAGFVAADGGDEIYRDIQLPYTRDVYRSQRLAKLMLAKSRDSETITFPAKYTASELSVNDTVFVNINRLGYSNRVFKVISWKMSDEGGIDLVLRSENSTVYDWVSGDAKEITEVPATTLPSAFDIEPPSEVTAAEINTTLNDGTIDSIIYVSWALADTIIVDSYEIRWKKTTSSDWLYHVVGDEIKEFRISNTEAGVTYQVEVRSLNRLKVASGWIVADNVSIVGKTVSTSAPSALALTSNINAIELAWVNPTDPDFYYTEIYESTTNDRNTATVIKRLLSEQIYLKRDPGTTYYYWIRSVNSSGIQSSFYPNTATTTISGQSRQIQSVDVGSGEIDYALHLAGVPTSLNDINSGEWSSFNGKTQTFYSTSTPTAVQVGDTWFNPTTLLWKRWDGASWIDSGNGFDATSLLTDDAGLGNTALWSGVTGTDKPDDNATATDPFNLVHNGDAERGDNRNFTSFVYQSTNGKSGSSCLKIVTGNISRFSDEYIPVNTSKVYVGRCSSRTDISNTQIYIGVACYDKDKVFIQPYQAYRSTARNTTLHSAASAGATTVNIVPPTTDWYGASNSYIQFDIKADFSDLPAVNTTYKITNIDKTPGTYWTITISTALTQGYATATDVGNSESGSTFNYFIAVAESPGLDWVDYEGLIGGGENLATNKPVDELFRYGTKYVRFLLLPNYVNTSDTTYIDDVLLTPLTQQIITPYNISKYIQALSVSGNEIASGTITANNIAASTITGSKIAAGTIAGSNIIAGTITASNIAAYTITGSKIAAGTISGNNIIAGTITAINIASSTITGSKIAAGTITANEIGANQIGATHIVAASITGSKIAAGTIAGSNIIAGTITVDKLNVSTLSAISADLGTITAGTITGATLQTAASGKRFVVSTASNEAEFYGDQGNGSVVKLCTVGIVAVGLDETIINAGNSNIGNDKIALNAEARSNIAGKFYSESGTGVSIQTATSLTSLYVSSITGGGGGSVATFQAGTGGSPSSFMTAVKAQALGSNGTGLVASGSRAHIVMTPAGGTGAPTHAGDAGSVYTNQTGCWYNVSGGTTWTQMA